MKRHTDFDAARAQVALAYIRQGGFPFVAADAAGIPAQAFFHWVRRGEQAGAREPLRGFAQSVRQAIAQARLLTELAVCKKDPKFWLCHGPGRETSEATGWTTAVRPTVRKETHGASVEDTRTFCSLILETLAPFPEARAKVAERLVEPTKPKNAPATGELPAAPTFRIMPPRWSNIQPSAN
jgi:hypothetical protein